MKKIFTTLLLLTLLPTQAKSPYTQAQIKSYTLEACRALPDLAAFNKWQDRLHAGIFPSRNFNQMIMTFFHEGFTDETIDMFSESYGNNDRRVAVTLSEAYTSALNQCYPQKPDLSHLTLRVNFHIYVENRSKAGRFAGIFVLDLILLRIGSTYRFFRGIFNSIF